MNDKTISLAILSLIVGAFAFAPSSAFAERDNDYRADKEQSRSFDRDNNYRADKQQSRNVERDKRSAIKSHKAEKQNLSRVERNSPQRAERKSPQRVERNRVVERHELETRRTVHIVRPQHVEQPRYYRPVPRSRYYLGVRIYRPHGYLYSGFGFYYSDQDAFRWLTFTALTLTIIDHLDEHQQRMHEQALIRATSAEVGDTLYWNERYASGSVTVLYIGSDSRGREYREFRQTVSSNGRTETSYGSAYLKSNGRWEASRLN